jgi:hypothetical protein
MPSAFLSEAVKAVPAGLPVETVRPQGDAAPCLEEASANLDLLLMG